MTCSSIPKVLNLTGLLFYPLLLLLTYFREFCLFYIVEQQPTPESVTEEQSEHLERSVADTTGIYFFLKILEQLA